MTAFRSPVDKLVNLADVNTTGAVDGQTLTKSGLTWLPGSVVLGSDLGAVAALSASNSGAANNAAIQAAVDALPSGGIVVLRPGTFSKTGTVNHGYRHHFVGAGKEATVLNQTDTNVAFQFLSQIQGAAYDLNAAPRYEGFTLSAKNAVKLNQSGNFATVFDKQAHLAGPVFRGLRLVGTYESAGDPNIDTNVVPTQATLAGYGIGLDLAKCFNTVFENTEVRGFGIGINLDGCDISNFRSGRVWNCGCWFWISGLSTYGGQIKIHGLDLLQNRRYGGITIDGSAATYGLPFTDIAHNYFETYTPAACYVRTIRDFETNLGPGNRFDSNTQGAAGTPVFDLKPRYSLRVFGNRYNANTADRSIVGSDYWSNSDPSQHLVYWHDNEPALPKPDFPAVVPGDESIDPYLLRYNNFKKGDLSGVAVTSFPFVLSGTTGRYVIKTTSPTFLWNARLKNTGHRNFRFRFTGRKVSSAGFVNVTYVEGGSTALFANFLGFTSTTEVEVREIVLSIPAAKVGTGYFLIELVNDGVEFESVELIPIPQGQGANIASAATITLPADSDFFVITGTTSVTSVAASWTGRRVTFAFSGALTFTDGSNLKLAGNFTTTADATISLVCDGTNWFEVARSVN